MSNTKGNVPFCFCTEKKQVITLFLEDNYVLVLAYPQRTELQSFTEKENNYPKCCKFAII